MELYQKLMENGEWRMEN